MIRIFASILIAGLLASSVEAGIAFDMNFANLPGSSVSNVTGIGKVVGTASSILGFHDNDGIAGITPGDRFEDFTVIRLDSFEDLGGDPIAVAGYGATHQLTIVTRFGGLQIGANSYIIDSISQFDVYADYGAGFTAATYNNLGTFANGVKVETGVLGGIGSGTNLSATVPNGAIAVFVQLQDLLHSVVGSGGYFETQTGTGTPLDTFGNLVVTGLFDGNNLVSPPATPRGGLITGSTMLGSVGPVVKGFDQMFGLTGSQLSNGTITSLTGFDFAFQTSSNISFAKSVATIPEPASLFVFGALGGLVAWRRRK